MDHIQRGESVKWDWEEILSVKEKRVKLLQCEQMLKYAIAVWKAKDTRALLSRTSPFSYFCPFNIETIPPYKESVSELGQIKLCSSPNNPLKDYTFEQLDKLILCCAENMPHCMMKYIDLLRPIWLPV
jgi:hypothetical protein